MSRSDQNNEMPPSNRAVQVSGCPLPTRRGLNREQAACFIGIGTSKFDQLIKDGRMPKPLKIDGRRLWDLRDLDRAFDELLGNDQDDKNPWD